MRATRFLPLLLWMVCLPPALVFGQGSTAYQVCNAGKVPVDAYFSLQGKVTAKQVEPG